MSSVNRKIEGNTPNVPQVTGSLSKKPMSPEKVAKMTFQVFLAQIPLIKWIAAQRNKPKELPVPPLYERGLEQPLLPSPSPEPQQAMPAKLASAVIIAPATTTPTPNITGPLRVPKSTRHFTFKKIDLKVSKMFLEIRGEDRFAAGGNSSIFTVWPISEEDRNVLLSIL
ncbi:MAG: hypothetical protein WCP39_07180, partial [Chlamydiota bacterium]